MGSKAANFSLWDQKVCAQLGKHAYHMLCGRAGIALDVKCLWAKADLHEGFVSRMRTRVVVNYKNLHHVVVIEQNAMEGSNFGFFTSHV